jgi:DNA uptake protein ComE-like DNA-binding protein
MREQPPTIPTPSGESGFVLLAVLLVSLVLIAAASTFTTAVRTRIGLMASVSQSAEAEALADAGISLAVLSIEGAHPTLDNVRTFAVGAPPAACLAPDGQSVITIEVRDEAGKININSGNQQLLLAFLTGLGISSDFAQSLLDGIVDYRDSDTSSRDGSPEATLSEPQGAGLKNRPFDVVEELAQVPGFPRSALEKARQFVTVYSDIDGFDPARSPPGLREIIATGALNIQNSTFSVAASSFAGSDDIPPQFIARSNQRALAIIATASTPSGAQFTREAIVKRSLNGSGAFVVRRWTQALHAIVAPTNGVLSPC